MLSSGPNSCGLCTDDASIGIRTWKTTGGVSALVGDEVNAVDGNAAQINTIGTPSSAITHYLVCTNFGFNIPPTAVITGILGEVDRWETSAASDDFDAAIRIVKGGIIKTTDKSSVDELPLSGSFPPDPQLYQSYGSSTDLWGETWTPADINSSNFGLAIAFTNATGGGVLVGHVRITISYELPFDAGVPI